MKLTLGLIASFLMSLLSCGASVQEVTFKRAQPLGQKSSYEMKNNVRARPSPESAPMDLTMDAKIETEVTSAQPNGNWTLATRLVSIDLKINGESQPAEAMPLAGKAFSMVMDRDGKVVETTGTENLLPGVDFKQIATQMNPAALLPSRPVRVGETWPIETSDDIKLPGGAVHQTTKGNGTLRSVNGGQALVDFDLDFAMSMVGGSDAITLSGSGKGKASMTYDLEKARAITNKSDITMEVALAEIMTGGRRHDTKSSVSTSMQVDLIEK
ncbi:MAG TPA: hypothetical protein VGV87_22740 [Blastocatellia bacterium]|nr:hypothetical protein [Blastocatellia bacterium]